MLSSAESRCPRVQWYLEGPSLSQRKEKDNGGNDLQGWTGRSGDRGCDEDIK